MQKTGTEERKKELQKRGGWATITLKRERAALYHEERARQR